MAMAQRAGGSAESSVHCSGPQRFSTVGLLDDRQRIDLWEQHNADALVGLDCRTRPGQRLDAVEVNRQLGCLRLASVAATPHLVERTPAQVGARPTDAVTLYFTIGGRSTFTQLRGRTRAIAPGTLLVCDGDRPFARGFAAGVRELVLVVPKAALRDAGFGGVGLGEASISRFDDGRNGPAKAAAASAVATNPHATALARLIAWELAGTADQGQSELEAQGAECKAIALLGALLVPELAHASDSRWLAITTHIDANLRDPALSASSIARATGTSERQLSRLASARGTTVPRVILGRRLDRAGRLLLTGSGATDAHRATIAEIAAFCGFSSHATFTRAFRAERGMTPSDARYADRLPTEVAGSDRDSARRA